jgi:Bacteriocin-protection, YdeI or OmpD-Associated/Domain of unknown function (DUF1905)
MAETPTPPAPRIRFRTTIRQTGKNTTGIEVPAELVAQLGTGKRPAVKVTINRHTYRSTVATMGGALMVSLSAENRALAGVAGGDEADVELELDTSPREVTVPPELAEALGRDPAAKKRFDGLSYTQRRAHVLSVEGAKTTETRSRRIATVMSALR